MPRQELVVEIAHKLRLNSKNWLTVRHLACGPLKEFLPPHNEEEVQEILDTLYFAGVIRWVASSLLFPESSDEESVYQWIE